MRGGTGVFTGRLPMVWIGNVISNPGANPNLPAHLQSFDLNAMTSDFKWPQIWTSNLAVDHQLPWGLLGSLEMVYSKDINAIYVRNADLNAPQRQLYDGRNYYTDAAGNNRLNYADTLFFGGIYVIDNTSDGYNYNVTAQLRKFFDFGLSAHLSYTYLMAKSSLKSTEIASVLWQENPIAEDANKPVLGFSEFGNRHRIVAAFNYRHQWDDTWATSIGFVTEIAEGNRFLGAGGNRYSFVYSGDVNGDGYSGNDLIYIPRYPYEARLVDYDYEDEDGNTVTVTAEEQWLDLNAFITQDDYLSEHRGEIAERFGGVNPWYINMDFRLLQDFALNISGHRHTFQLSVDILNFLNLLNSDWGIRKVANSAATSPLQLAGFDAEGQPTFNFRERPASTYVADLNVYSRWRIQIGLRYLFN
jgi:hypothetical protein